MENNLNRFIEAQEKDFEKALAEVSSGRKKSHWMWYIFPQIKGLGFSSMSKFFALEDLYEAESYLQHPVLGHRLREISNALLKLDTNDANKVMGSPDDFKLRSSMTIFSEVPSADPVFSKVLEKFFNGKKDDTTLEILQNKDQS